MTHVVFGQTKVVVFYFTSYRYKSYLPPPPTKEMFLKISHKCSYQVTKFFLFMKPCIKFRNCGTPPPQGQLQHLTKSQ